MYVLIVAIDEWKRMGYVPLDFNVERATNYYYNPFHGRVGVQYGTYEMVCNVCTKCYAWGDHFREGDKETITKDTK